MFSAFHRLTSDEIWHHYSGGSVATEVIEADGLHRSETIAEMDSQQAVMSAGRDWLVATFPQQRALIERWTREE